jgi:multidrug efflux pump subunit AcrA (membrane-fusion protein)
LKASVQARTATSWLASVLILVAGGVAFAYLVHKPKPPANAISHHLRPLVQTSPLAAHHGSLNLKVDGLVVPFREVSLAAEVGGRVTRKEDVCRPGRIAAKGTPLLEIDPRDYQLRVRRFQTQLEQAQSSLNELYVESKNTELLVQLAQEDVELNHAEVVRLQTLKSGAVAASDFDQAKRAELAARNVLQTLNNQLQLFRARQDRLQSSEKLAQTELEQAKLDLERTRIVSPFDGVVVKESVEQDSFVEKGMPLVVIEDTSAVEVRCNLKMDQVTWLWRQESAVEGSSAPQGLYQVPKTPVTVKYHMAGHDFYWEGIVSRYEGVGLDERTRMVPCRVLVKQPRGSLRADAESEHSPIPPPLVRGMYVGLELHVSPNVPLGRVPEQAVRPGKTILVVREGRIRILRDIRLVELISQTNDAGTTTKEWLIELAGSGLKLNDEVVISPLNFVTDGLEVRQQKNEVNHSLGNQ